MDSSTRNVTLTSRSAAPRPTVLATSLAIVIGLSAAAQATQLVPLPKPRPIPRAAAPHPVPHASLPHVAADKTAPAAAAAPATSAPKIAVRPGPAAAAVAALPPSTRLHAALPPTHKLPPQAAVAAPSSTSQADAAALENVIELVRKRNPADATQAEAAIADPLARKLAEWILLRSDDNGASFERYRAFISANPSWPSQTFLRRRIEAALWDDHRDDATVWAWFENESPLSAKGKFSLARVMIARGDRANAERLV